jgi:uncharacterized protein YndB with AHSA1/START domain
MENIISVQTTVNTPVEKAWEIWTTPIHITRWNNASEDWHTPTAINDLREGGKFSCRMEARDGSMGFDFEGTYDLVILNKKIGYTMSDSRRVIIEFTSQGNQTHIKETFEAETENSVELQQQGWQAIMDNF